MPPVGRARSKLPVSPKGGAGRGAGEASRRPRCSKRPSKEPGAPAWLPSACTLPLLLPTTLEQACTLTLGVPGSGLASGGGGGGLAATRASAP
eukprot:6460705-Alexandrium_andersonii.AAC.1